ncbi:uncharacterized protein LOC131667401 [Phymastichus coffea]|uniref:uncharacterized protein LOC131667401 n=1 Tax=Phymastichus coffea TaxID=108790 RepID=UPI00273B6A6F|nr:uncharacterized protein LOC131667401 [Phymastichus coffea]
MKKTIIYAAYFIFCLLQTSTVDADTKNDADGISDIDESEETTVRSNNAIAKLINAKNGRDDPRLSVERDNSSSSGFAVKFGPYFRSVYGYYAFIYGRTPRQPNFRQYVFACSLCKCISNDTSLSNLPADFFIPRQIIRMIFTGIDNKCQPEGGRSDTSFSSPMLSTAYVNADENDKNYKGAPLPVTLPFDLMVNIITSQDTFHEDISYVFQVNFTVEALDSSKESEGKLGYYCLNKKWKYWIIWRICKVYKFVESIFGKAE